MTSQFEPKSGLGLLLKVFLAPFKLQTFSKSLSYEERRIWFFKGLKWLVIITMTGVFISFCVALTFDTLGYIPCDCPPSDSVENWRQQTDVVSRITFMCRLIAKEIISSDFGLFLLAGIIFGIHQCLSGNLVGGFAILFFMSFTGNILVTAILKIPDVFF